MSDRIRVLLAAVLIVILSACCLLLAALPVDADAPPGRWVRLRPPVVRRPGLVRISYYGPHYAKAPHWCASGRRYAADGWWVALGPTMLRQARKLSGQEWPQVRLTLPGRGKFVLPVQDTGGSANGWELEVDLPDWTWHYLTTLPPETGIVYGGCEAWVPIDRR